MAGNALPGSVIVIEIRPAPGSRVVTIITRSRGGNMAHGFIANVTSITRPGSYGIMIHIRGWGCARGRQTLQSHIRRFPAQCGNSTRGSRGLEYRQPGFRGMTDSALLRSRYVVTGFVIGVACGTRISDSDVIKMRRRPMYGAVTKAAVCGGGNMIRGFIFTMAGYTTGRNISVVKSRWCPSYGAMAVIANSAGL